MKLTELINLIEINGFSLFLIHTDILEAQPDWLICDSFDGIGFSTHINSQKSEYETEGSKDSHLR